MATIGPRAELGFALATRLIADRGRRFTRRHLTALFWPDVEEQKAAHSLSEALHRLRGRGLPVQGDSTQAVWIERDAVTLDVERIPTMAPAELVTCDFTVLPGFAPRGAPALHDWADEYRHQLTIQTVRNLAIPIATAEREGNWEIALALAEHALQLDGEDPTALTARARAAAKLSELRTPFERARAAPANHEGHSKSGRTVHESPPMACELRPAMGAPQTGLFVGREQELAVLRSAWESARGGRGKRVLIHGASGIGKTRLVRQFRNLVRQAGGVMADVQSDPGDATRPLSAFLRLVPKLRSLPGAAAVAPDLRPYLDRLTEINGVNSAWPDPADTPYILSCIERAVDELVDSIADEQPLVIVVDNAQWMDPESNRLLDAQALALSSRSVLIIGIWCETHDALPPSACAFAIPIKVGALGDASARALAQDRVERAGRTADEGFVEWLVRVGEGNPLRLEEIVAYWLEGGAPFELPPTISAVLKGRVAALAPHDRQVLQAVALLGQQATLVRVQRIVALGQVPFVTSLNSLAANGFIEVEDAGSLVQPAGEYRIRCRHDAIADAATAELSAAGRAVLHRAIALELEQEPSASADVLWDRASHWSGGHAPADAVRTAVSCARHLAAVGLADAGTAACRQVLNEPLPESARAQALVALAHTLHQGWRWREVLTTAEELRRLAETTTCHDDVELCVLDARWQMQEDRERTLDDAIRCSSARDASAAHRVSAAAIAIKLATNAGNLRKVHEAFEAISGILNEPDVGATDRVTVTMMYHAVGGSLPVAAECARELVTASRTMAEPARLRALINSASALARAGHCAEALDICEQAAHDAVRRRLTPIAAAAAHRAANIALDAGEIAPARDWTDRFAAHAAQNDVRRQTAVSLARARLAYHDGDLDATDRLLGRGDTPIWVDASPAFAATSLATAIAAASSRPAADRDLRSLLAAVLPLHVRLEAMGAHDFVTFAIAAGYHALGEPARAHAMLDRYLKQHRREPTPIPERFAAMLDGADWGAPTTG